MHVHPGAEELNRVFHADLAITSASLPFLRAMQSLPGTKKDRTAHINDLHHRYQQWVEEPVSEGQAVRMYEQTDTYRNFGG